MPTFTFMRIKQLEFFIGESVKTLDDTG